MNGVSPQKSSVLFRNYFYSKRAQFPWCEKLPKCTHPSEVKHLLWWSLTWTILPPFSISPLLTGLVTFHKEAHCPPIPALPFLLSPSTLWLDTSASPLSLSSPSSSTPGSQWYCMWTWSSHQCLWSSVALSVKGNWWDPVSYDLLVLSFIEAIVPYA